MLPGQHPVDDHRFDTFGRLHGLIVGRAIAYRGRIEEKDIGVLAHLDGPAIPQAEVSRGQSAHLPDRRFKRKETDVAAIVA